MDGLQIITFTLNKSARASDELGYSGFLCQRGDSKGTVSLQRRRIAGKHQDEEFLVAE